MQYNLKNGLNTIKAEGGNNWSKISNEQTAFYTEYKNYGLRFKPDSRVNRAHQQADAERQEYTLILKDGIQSVNSNVTLYLGKCLAVPMQRYCTDLVGTWFAFSASSPLRGRY